MGWHSSVLIVILVFAILFSLLYGATVYTPEIAMSEPRITQEQAIEIVQQDLEAKGLTPIREIMAFQDIDNFENRSYVPLSDFQEGEYRLELASANEGGSTVTVRLEGMSGSDNSNIIKDCSESADSLVCIVSCFSEGKMFWIVDVFSEYYAVNAISGEIIFSQNRQQQMMENDSQVAECFNT